MTLRLQCKQQNQNTLMYTVIVYLCFNEKFKIEDFKISIKS